MHNNKIVFSFLSFSFISFSFISKRLKPNLLFACFMLMFCAAPLSANANQSFDELKVQIPANTPLKVFIESTDENTLQIGGSEALVNYRWMTSQSGTFPEFFRINVKQQGEHSWDATARTAANDAVIKQGDWVYASYYARAVEQNKDINIRGFIERSVPDWMMISDASVAAGSSWTRVVASGKAPEDLAKGSVYLSLHLAAKAQQVDIAEIVFVALPGKLEQSLFPATQLSYVGMEEDAKWRSQAKQMIEQHRMADFKVFVLNKQGEALADTKIDISMQDVDYELGSMAHGVIVDDSELGEQYRVWFSEFFNYATATIYWADWGWENPEVRETYLQKMAYFKAQNIKMRGHVLLYPAFRFSPKVLVDLQDDREAFIARVNQQIDEMVPILKAYGVQEYDVINELRAEKEWLDIVGIDTVVKWYKRVHALHPDAILYINENSILTDGGDNQGQKDHYFRLIEKLLAKGAPIHGIGMQGHFNGIVTPVEKMWEILDRFASFKLPIRITEYDTDTRDELGQAAFDTDFYEAMYAHPATIGITRWGFYEPLMWRPNGALIDSENTLKPNALAYKKWLNALREHRTSIVSDKTGTAVFRAKYGRFKLKVEGEDFECEFTQPPINQTLETFTQSCTLRLSN